MAKNGAMEQFEDRLDSLKDSMRNLVDVGASKMSGVKDTVISSSKTGLKRTGSLIKQHPFIAIGIAFGIGFIAMRLLRH
jgi:ElaB/YqjD/DUF883 family membrane-anchored ribosome-binding protein